MTLLPGRALAGGVYAAIDYEARKVALWVRLWGKRVWFPFRRELVAGRREITPTAGGSSSAYRSE